MSEEEPKGAPLYPPDKPAGEPVVVAEVAPAAVAALVEAARAAPEAMAPEAAKPTLGLSAKSAEAIVTAAVTSTPPKAPETVAQETERAKMTAGQRTTSMAWELVKAIVAVAFTVVSLYVTARLALAVLDPSTSPNVQAAALAALVFLTTSCSAILHTYMATVNHTKVGGVGDKGDHDR